MKYYALDSGDKMPAIGLGTWQLDDVADSVGNAIDAGYRLIDTSSDYNSQEGIGKALKKSNLKRDDIFLVTKIEEYDDPFDRTESNLKELQLDYADLMLIHRPPKNDPGIDLWKGLIKCKEKGLVRNIGVSNYSADQINKLISETDVVPSVNQIEWTPFGNNKGFKEYCDKQNILIQAYSPLTRGERLDYKLLNKLADKYNKSAAQVILRWDIELGICPIPKASSQSHQKENMNIFDFKLEYEDIEMLWDLNEEYTALTPPLPYIEYV